MCWCQSRSANRSREKRRKTFALDPPRPEGIRCVDSQSFRTQDFWFYDLAHNLGRTNKIKGCRPPAGIDNDEDDAQLLPIRAGLDLNREHPFSFSSLCPCPVSPTPTPHPNNKKRPARETSTSSSLPPATMMTPISTNRIHTVRLLSGRMRESKIITTVSEIYHTSTWSSPLWLGRDLNIWMSGSLIAEILSFLKVMRRNA